MEFVNLYVQTEYSLLNSTMKIAKLVNTAKDYGYNSLAITDINNMHGVIKFYLHCKKNDIKPIIGLCINIQTEYDNDNLLLLYAINNIGYQNLLKIATLKKTTGMLSLKVIQEYKAGLLAILPSDESEVVRAYQNKDIEYAKRSCEAYKRIFDKIYLGLDMQTFQMRHLIDELIAFGEMLDIKCVAINKACYFSTDEFEAYTVLRCIEKNASGYPYLEKEEALSFLNKQDYMDMFKDYSFLLTNTLDIAALCDVDIRFDEYKLPKFFEDDNLSDKAYNYLTDLCKFGLSKRLKGQSNIDVGKYKERLFYELSIINKMGFCDYFLIVYDFVKFAKKSGILVGPGRGSAPSALISYVLGITDIDPLQYDLLFERFLNPERITMPDIDIDFPDNRRDEVIRYVGEKYGKHRVAHISTFNTFGPKMAIRDIVRIMKLSDMYLNEIMKYIPHYGGSIDKIVEDNPKLQQIMRSDDVILKVISLASIIEGLPRNTSVHAAGIIINPDELVKYTPLQNGINNLYQTQFDATDLEKLGLLKIDFLGLSNLKIIDEVSKLIREENIDFDIKNITLDDKRVYDMIASGDTDGIFQLESKGMRNTLIAVKPVSITEIAHCNALFRPGPMEMIPTFSKRKFRLEKVTYLHQDLKPILESTYGIIVFQEQIMQIAQVVAGYTLGMADVLRRAVSKRIAFILEKERGQFVENAIKRGYTSEVSNQIYDYIVKFANYGFNKSHAISYSLIGYQMTYLKVYYYKYFISNLMNGSIGSISSIKVYINNCQKNGITVMPPSINHSTGKFVVLGNNIYYSLLGIEDIGNITLKDLLTERNENGHFGNYDDFIRRTKDILNKRITSNLIYAGALDEFGLSRKYMIEEYDNSVDKANFSSMLKEDLVERPMSDEEYSFEIVSMREREVLKLNIKYSLFSKHQDLKIAKKTVDLSNLKAGMNARILFVIKKIKTITTKNGDEMAFLELQDDSDIIDGVIFPEQYKKYKEILRVGYLYFSTANVENRNGKMQIIIENIISI